MITALLGWRGYAAAGAACLVLGFGGGWKVCDALADAAWARRDLADSQIRETALSDNLRRGEVAQKISAGVGEKSSLRQVEIRNQTIEIIREVPVHVTPKSDSGCIIPVGFVHVHDAAASSTPTLPDPAAAPHDAPTDITLSAVAVTVAENYGTCRADQERLTSLQAWIKAQAEAWNQTP